MRHLFLAIPFFVLAVGAHEIVVEPVDIEIKIEPSQIHARIQSHADYWKGAVFQLHVIHSLPAGHWEEKYLKIAKDIVEKSFQLKMDDRSLSVGSFDAHYVEEPFQKENARVVFDVTYPIASIGKRLSGRAQFFQALVDESIAEHQYEKNKDDFFTHLRIIGARKIDLKLMFDRPEFDVPLEGLQVTAWQQSAEKIKAILFSALSSPFFWIVLLAAGAQIYRRFFKRSEE
jgi:hypothetical protein